MDGSRYALSGLIRQPGRVGKAAGGYLPPAPPPPNPPPPPKPPPPPNPPPELPWLGGEKLIRGRKAWFIPIAPTGRPVSATRILRFFIACSTLSPTPSAVP